MCVVSIARAISGGMRKPCKERGQGTLLEVKVHSHCEHRQVTTITKRNNKVVIIKTIFFLVGTLIQQYTHNTVHACLLSTGLCVCVCYRNSGGLMDNEMSLSWCNVFSLCPTFERETVRQRWFGSTCLFCDLI